jgi:hypothetical protein
MTDLREPAASLSDNHRRAISTTLKIVDERLCEFEQIANGREIRSVFYRESNDLTDAQRARLLDQIARARRIMLRIRDTLHLEPGVYSLSRQVRGAGSSLWESLIETQSRRLAVYGRVPPALADYIDPALDRLIACVLSITSAAGAQADGAGAEGEEGPDDGPSPPGPGPTRR